MTLTPFPPDCLAGFSATLSAYSWMYGSASSKVLNFLYHRRPGILYFHWRSRMLAFDISSSATFLPAPMHLIPLSSMRSGTPWKFGSSGPMKTKSAPVFWAALIIAP